MLKPTPLNTIAYCCASQTSAVARAAGVEPVTSPPFNATTFDPGELYGRDLLYIALHGRRGSHLWYGDNDIPALTAFAFRGMDLSRTVVFIACCHFVDSPFLRILLQARPRLLIGGQGNHYTRRGRLVGPHLLGFYFRRALERTRRPERAFAIARRKLELHNLSLLPAAAGSQRVREDLAANTDTLAFRVYPKEPIPQ